MIERDDIYLAKAQEALSGAESEYVNGRGLQGIDHYRETYFTPEEQIAQQARRFMELPKFPNRT